MQKVLAANHVVRPQPRKAVLQIIAPYTAHVSRSIVQSLLGEEKKSKYMSGQEKLATCLVNGYKHGSVRSKRRLKVLDRGEKLEA